MALEILMRSAAAIFSLWFLVIFLLVIHETGHLIVLAYYKLRPDKVVIGNIRLFSLTVGGVQHDFGLFPIFAFTISKDYAYAPPDQRAVVAIAGPVTSLLLGWALLGFDAIYPGWFTKLAASASMALAAWNLIPFPPLDGWPILEWQLIKRGFKINPKHRAVLLAFGVVSIAVLAVMTWD